MSIRARMTENNMALPGEKVYQYFVEIMTDDGVLVIEVKTANQAQEIAGKLRHYAIRSVLKKDP